MENIRLLEEKIEKNPALILQLMKKIGTGEIYEGYESAEDSEKIDICGIDNAIRDNYEMLASAEQSEITAGILEILCTEHADEVLDRYRDIFAFLIPELEAMFDFDQKSPYHNRDVWHHTLCGVKNVRPDPDLRMTMLLHDIAKPVVFILDDNGRGRFVGHPAKGAEMAEIILRRMDFSEEKIRKICEYVRLHDIKMKPILEDVIPIYDHLGPEGFEDLLDIKRADASGKYEQYLVIAEEKNEALRGCVREYLSENGNVNM